MLETRDITGVEILSVGKWHGTGCPPAGCAFSTDDLDEIAATYEATRDELNPPLKLGHTEQQKLLQEDGLPAAGWAANVRRVGQKLVADFLKVPKQIADLIDVGAYRTRSVELAENLDVGGKTYRVAMTGIALLGADIPAVENLSDITALYQARQLSLAKNTKAVMFTAHQATRKTDFTLPAGMSYEDLGAALRTAWIEQSPGAGDDVWVSDLYENSAIFCNEGRYWQQPYAVGKNGAISLSGMPAEVQRVTEWRAMSRFTYADEAEHALASVQAFTQRTEQLAALRAKDGRSLSEKHRERLAQQLESVRELAQSIETLLADKAPAAVEDPDYSSVMRARARMAQLRVAELTGA